MDPSSRKEQSGMSLLAALALAFALVAVSLVWLSQHRRLAAEHQAAEVAAQAAAEQARAEEDARIKETAEEERAKETQAAMNRKKAEERAAVESLKGLLLRWNDAIAVAEGSARISLPGPVATLQGIKRETDAAEVPPCLGPAKANLVGAMQLTINGFIEFMKKQEGLSSLSFTEAKSRLDAFSTLINSCPEA